MKPDSNLHNPNAAYLRALISRTGLSQQAIARRIGVSPRRMRAYLSANAGAPAPYLVQFALEALAAAAGAADSAKHSTCVDYETAMAILKAAGGRVTISREDRKLSPGDWLDRDEDPRTGDITYTFRWRAKGR